MHGTMPGGHRMQLVVLAALYHQVFQPVPNFKHWLRNGLEELTAACTHSYRMMHKELEVYFQGIRITLNKS
jgi:hypothetical protein